jgi:hypothetical protein
MNAFVTAFNKTKFWTKKHSPELLIAGGIIMAAGAIVSACFATKKAGEILPPATKKIAEIHDNLKDSNKIANKQIDPKEEKRELAKVYAKTGGKLLLVYAPTVVMFAASVSCILGSHNIMKGRNLALAAAYTTLDNGYKAYRKRVKDKIGETAEEAIFKDVRDEKKEVVDKNGELKTKTVKTPHMTDDADPYTALYACGNRGWERDAKLNYDYLMLHQAYLNHKLQAQGFLFLSDVYDELGFDAKMLGADKIRASHILGWIYDPKDPTRDNYVSFGLTDKYGISKSRVSAQIENNESDFWLEFNCDGDILNLSKDPTKKTFSKYAKEGCC